MVFGGTFFGQASHHHERAVLPTPADEWIADAALLEIEEEEDVTATAAMTKLVDTNTMATKMGASPLSWTALVANKQDGSTDPFSSSTAVVKTTGSNNIVNNNNDEMRDDNPFILRNEEEVNKTKRIDNNENVDDEAIVTSASSSSTILSDIELSLLPTTNDINNVHAADESSIITTHPDLPVHMISPTWTTKYNTNNNPFFLDGGESIGSLTIYTDEGSSLLSAVDVDNGHVTHVSKTKNDNENEMKEEDDKGGKREYKKEMKDKGREYKKALSSSSTPTVTTTPRGSRTLSMKNIFQMRMKKNKVEKKIAVVVAQPTTTSSKVVSDEGGSNGASSSDRLQEKATPKISNISIDNSASEVPPADDVADNNSVIIHQSTNHEARSVEEEIPITACDVDQTFSTSTDALFANACISMGFNNNGSSDAVAAAIPQTCTKNNEEREDCSVVTTFVNDISTVVKVKMNESVESINKLITTVAILPAADDLGDNTAKVALVGSSTNKPSDPMVLPGDLTPIQEVGDSNDDVDVKLLPRDVFGRIINQELEKREVLPVELLPRDVFGRIKVDDRELGDVLATAANTTTTTTIAAITSLVTILDIPKSDRMLARYQGREEELLSNLKTMLAKHLDGQTAVTIGKITSLIKELGLPKSPDEMLTEYKGREDVLLKILKFVKDKQQVVDGGHDNVSVGDVSANTTIAAISSLVAILDLPKSTDKILKKYKGREGQLLANLKTMLAKQIDDNKSEANEENAATVAEITSLIDELNLPKSVDEMLIEYKGREENLLLNLKLIEETHQVQSPVTPVKVNVDVVDDVASPTNQKESVNVKPKPTTPKARRIKSNSMKKLFMSVGLIEKSSKGKMTGTAVENKSKVSEEEDRKAIIAEIRSLITDLSLPKSADKMVEKYKGREEELLTNLNKMKSKQMKDATIVEITSLIKELSLPKSGDKILTEYKGREDELLKDLKLTATAEITSLITDLSLPKSADKMLTRYKGREDELLANLKKMKANQAEDKNVEKKATIAEITSLLEELSLPKSADEMLTEYKGREGDLLKNLKSIKANQQVTDEDGDTAFSFLLGATQDIFGRIKDGLQGKYQQDVAEDDDAVKMQEVVDDNNVQQTTSANTLVDDQPSGSSHERKSSDNAHYSSVVPTTRDIFGRFNYVEVGSEVDTPSRWPLLENLLLAEVSSVSRENDIKPAIITSDEVVLENEVDETVMMEDIESTSQKSLVPVESLDPPVESQVHKPTSNPATATIVVEQITSLDLNNENNNVDEVKDEERHVKLTIKSQPRKNFFSNWGQNKSSAPLSQKSATCPPPPSIELDEESNKVKMIVHNIIQELKKEDVNKDNTMTEDELSSDNQTIQNSIDTSNQIEMLSKASSEMEASQLTWPTFFTSSVQTELNENIHDKVPAPADVIDVMDERADKVANVSNDTIELNERLDRLESDSSENNIELSLIEEAVGEILGGDGVKSEKKKNKFKLKLFEQSSVREESENIIEYHELKNLSPVGVEPAIGEVKKAGDSISNILPVVLDKVSQPSSVSPISKLFLYTDLDPLIKKAEPAAEKVAPIKSVDDFPCIKSPRQSLKDLEAAISLKDDDKTPKMGRIRTFDKPFSKRFVFDTVNSVNSADSYFEGSTEVAFDQVAFDQEFGIRGKQEHYAANSKETKKKKDKKLSDDVEHDDDPSHVDSCESNIELSLVEDEDAAVEEKFTKRPKFNRWGNRIKKTKASMKDKKHTNQEPKGFANASVNENALFKPSIRELQKTLPPIGNDVINASRTVRMTEVPYIASPKVASPTASKTGTKKKSLSIETKLSMSEPMNKSERKKRKEKMMRRKKSKKHSSDRVTEQPYPAISATYSSESYESVDSDDPLDYITDFLCCGDDTL